jgi:polyphosphate glucokinase
VKVLGIDIGGTGIKGAVVDTKHGVLKTDRLRLLTPHPATPEAVADVVGQLTKHFDWDGLVGCTFPGVTKGSVIHTAANLTPEWPGLDGAELFGKATGCDVVLMNDADAAGVAEHAFGAAGGHGGLVIVLTLGTGIGSAVLHAGKLMPNSELGHLELNGGDAEKYAAESVREALDLSWEDWAARVTEYLVMVEDLFWPDVFVLGGGVSKKADKFLPLLKCRTKVVPAKLQNQAGIIGAALGAEWSAERGRTKHGKGKKK